MRETEKKSRIKDERREDLILGTIRSIAGIGYSDSTINSICEAAGLSRGLIGYYFKGKDELLIEAYRYLVAQADRDARQAIETAGTDSLERLKAATHMYFSRIQREREESLVTWACLGVAPWNPAMLELTRTLWRRYRRWIERMIAAAAAERNLDIDARKAALTYSQMADGFWMGWVLDPEAYSLEEAEAIVNGWLMDLLGEKARRKPASRPRKRAGPANSQAGGEAKA